ncbi:hypothetical protein COMA1_10181 [Candidatus Nitrospira nitrosa]|uniref:Uncharacterized protein n=1 Tax=Candidatus Nitrospira nitrosa TaxID=1742972 RepID=A0A0S4L904_9BACT|nr:hypothetical protein COMA1_10181 [Candidatus Nitrospira nitrosa]
MDCALPATTARQPVHRLAAREYDPKESAEETPTGFPLDARLSLTALTRLIQRHHHSC